MSDTDSSANSQPELPAKPGASPEGAATTSPSQRTDLRLALTKKQRHIGERIIELGIFTVATLSIVFIFLIFFFVFREAAPIFFGGHAKDTVAVSTPASSSGSTATGGSAASGSTATNGTGGSDMEVYNPETGSIGDSSAKGAVASADSGGKGSGSSASGSDQMEVYNPETGSIGDSTAKAGGSASTDSGTGNGSEMEVYNPETGSVPSASTSTGVIPDSVARATAEAAARRIVGNDYPILTHDSPIKLGYLFYDNWQPNSEHPRYGIYPIIIGTLKTTIVALLVATPLAILAALYTAFFAPGWLRETLKPALEILAGFPSVVLGFFCLMTVATLVQTVFQVDYRINAVVGGIGLALAVIPIIYTIADDALRAIPGSLREAALAIGATEWQAAYQVILPAATPGIFAAILLGLGRAFGETMIALMATGNAGTVGWSFFVPVRTFAATIGAEMGEVVFGSPHYQLLFLLGIILFLFSFGINFVTEFYVKQRLIKRFRGS